MARIEDGKVVGQGICSECKAMCNAIVYDDSFDHAFGTRSQYHVGSDCCDAEVIEYCEE
jgi:hypothetical protein